MSKTEILFHSTVQYEIPDEISALLVSVCHISVSEYNSVAKLMGALKWSSRSFKLH